MHLFTKNDLSLLHRLVLASNFTSIAPIYTIPECSTNLQNDQVKIDEVFLLIQNSSCFLNSSCFDCTIDSSFAQFFAADLLHMPYWCKNCGVVFADTPFLANKECHITRDFFSNGFEIVLRRWPISFCTILASKVFSHPLFLPPL